MKALRIILRVFGVLFIMINALGYFGPVRPREEDTAGVIGSFIGKHLLFAVGTLLLWWAYKIKKKSKKHEVESLVDSLPG